MNSHQSLTLVSAITDWEVLRENLLASPCLHTDRPLQFIFKQGYSAAGLAYNEALEAARHDLVIFVHQDVYLPEQWLDQVMTSIVALETFDPHWGVLGCYGRSRDHALGIGRVYTTGCQWHGSRILQPVQVDTLDEIVLIVRQSAGLRFDGRLPFFHLYGTDLCLTAGEAGMNSYVLPAPCIHNTHQMIELPPEYHACYFYIKSKWKTCLPIPAPCSRISWWNEDIYLKKCRSFIRCLLGKPSVRLSRVRQPASLFRHLCADL